jgi:hypothetical protein
MIINLKFLNGNTKKVDVISGTTIKDIKIEHLKLTDSNLDDIKIIYAGKILNNDQLLDKLSLSDESFFVILTTTKSTLDNLTKKTDSSYADSSDCESIDGDLFLISDDEVLITDNKGADSKETGADSKETGSDSKETESINYQETVDKNNLKFIELSTDTDFKILINILFNKPEYLSYALKFVQSGMIFNRPDKIESSDTNYLTELNELKKLNIIDDEEKLKKALAISMGDIQIAIRYIYQSQFDENFAI